jgi:tetratricopeptide (TPR) repeat protein
VSLSEATLEQLLQFLPAIEELEVLRLRMIVAASPDPGKEWDSSSSYATIDKRLLTPERVEQSLDAAESALRDYVSMLHDGLRPAFRSYFAGDAEGAARHLLVLGEQHEAVGRARGAEQCYKAALMMSLPLPDKSLQVLALRRMGRVALSLAQLPEATSYYERSAELAHDSGDVRAEVAARTGVGNVRMYQGRWPDAERIYREALDLAQTVDSSEATLELGQLYNNLGSATTRTGELAESEQWLERALAVWGEVKSPIDEAVCLMNLGHLRENQERLAETQEAYEAALGLPVPTSFKTLAAADLADIYLKEGYVTRAEEMARVAEEHAIAASSPYSLAYMYRNRGNLARARGHEDGFTFYEKALEIARAKGYPSLEADTLADYAELRRVTGGVEEAEAYLERARDIFTQLGASQNAARVQRSLDGLRSGIELPVAAAGD